MGEAKRRKLLDPSFGKHLPPIVTILSEGSFVYDLADQLFKDIRSQYQLAFYVLVEQEDFKGYGIFWCVINGRKNICVGSLLVPHPDCQKGKTEFETWFQRHRKYVDLQVSHHAKAILEKHQVIILKDNY